MDLLQPFNFAGWSHSLSWLRQDLIGNTEGFAYLGVWPIILIFVSIALNPRLFLQILAKVRKNPIFSLLLVVLLLFALTNKITVGRNEFEYRIPNFLEDYYGIFRASGRSGIATNFPVFCCFNSIIFTPPNSFIFFEVDYIAKYIFDLEIEERLTFLIV